MIILVAAKMTKITHNICTIDITGRNCILPEALSDQRDHVMCFVSRNNKSDLQTHSRSL